MRRCCGGEQAQEGVAASRPESAQARGRALLNLRLADAEGGLLGRTLLCLTSNKVTSAAPSPIFPSGRRSQNIPGTLRTRACRTGCLSRACAGWGDAGQRGAACPTKSHRMTLLSCARPRAIPHCRRWRAAWCTGWPF